MPRYTREEAKELGYLLDIGGRLYARRMRDGCPEIKKALNDLFNKMKSDLRLMRHKNKYRDTLRMIILDLFYKYVHDHRVCTGYSRDRNKYSKGKYYGNLFLSYDITIAVIEHLKDNKYIDDIEPYHDPLEREDHSFSARMKATPLLIAFLNGYNVSLNMIDNNQVLNRVKLNEKIKVKKFDKKLMKMVNKKIKREVDFEDNGITLRYKAELHYINELIVSRPILLAITDGGIRSLNEHISNNNDKDKRRMVDFGRTAITRGFIKDFEHGGRFYSGWWQTIPKEYRKYITIDDEPTVELDYSGLHINMLYALENLPLPEEDVYHLPGVDMALCSRPLVKQLLLNMINSKDEKSAITSITQEIHKGGESYGLRRLTPEDRYKFLKDILERIKSKHEPIKQHFCTSAGSRLQFLDSEIARDIMISLRRDNVVALPIHDSFLVSYKYKEQLEHEMKYAFGVKFGQECKIKPDISFWDEFEAIKGSEVMSELSTFTSLCEKYPNTHKKEEHTIYFSYLDMIKS